MLLVPEPSTLRPRRATGRARVCCTVTDRAGRPWLGDPRTALVAMIETFATSASVYQAAAELEFYLLDAGRGAGRPGGYFGGLERARPAP